LATIFPIFLDTIENEQPFVHSSKDLVEMNTNDREMNMERTMEVGLKIKENRLISTD